MKKFFLLTAICAFTMSAFAQKLKDVEKLVVLQKFKEAKTMIDQVVLNPDEAKKADLWLYKGKVYNVLSNDSLMTPKMSFDYKNHALDAYKKYQELDSKEEDMKANGYREYLELYAGFYDLGANAYNAQDYTTSHDAFKQALLVEDYAKAKSYTYKEITFPPFDTTLVLYIATTADLNKDRDAAIPYFQQLVDKGANGANNEQAYQIVIDYYSKKGDMEKTQAAINKARTVYPENPLWDDLEIRTSSNGDKALMMAKYDELLKKNPSNFNLGYNYAVELFNALYARGEERPKDKAAAQTKLTEVLTTTIASDKGMDAEVLMANHLFNVFADQSGEVTMAKDAKKKAELTKQMNATGDKVVPYAESIIKKIEAMPNAANKELANKKIMLGFLMDVYEQKGNTAKADEYKKLREAVKL